MLYSRNDVQRNKEFYEYITTMHMLCIIVLLSVLIMSSAIFEDKFYMFNLRLLVLFSLLGFVGILICNSTDILMPQRDKHFPWGQLVYIVFPLIVVLIVLFEFSEDIIYVEAILILPVLIAASIMGKNYGLIMATTCSIALIYYHFLNLLNSNIYQAFESGIVLFSLMYMVGWFIGGLTDMEKKYRNNLTVLASTDMLTGLYNHRYFQERLKEHIENASDQRPLALILIDIDYFKHYNDSYGHLEGDNVLKAIGTLMNETVNEPGFAARYGGEEFVVVVPDCDSQRAIAIAEEIRRQVEVKEFPGEEHQPGGKLTISCGIAAYPNQASSVQELIKYADQALYKAKYLNKNMVELFFSVFDGLELEEDEKKLVESIRTLVSVINAKDRYTYGHSERVTEYAAKLAKRAGVADEDIRLLKYAAFLHDIGKIEIERNILNKTETLSKEEWDILKQHPRWGSDIVRSVTQLQPTAVIILNHHENYDGSGYPGGLSGEDIPLLAKIIRIADSYDAMTSHRPYRKNMSSAVALEELKRCSGTIFDPELARHFAEMIEEGDSLTQ